MTRTRPYHSPIRAEQARQTRRALVAAATDLFLERGYRATTIDAVADRAGVSRKTVFASVGGKPALLELAWDWGLVGDDEPVPMADRPQIKEIEASTDPAMVIRLWSAHITRISGRVAPLSRVTLAAADVDEQVAELWRTSLRQRRYGATYLVRHLGHLGGLRSGLSRRKATDVCWHYMDPRHYSNLVEGCGWSDAAFRDWLTRTLSAELLD